MAENDPLSAVLAGKRALLAEASAGGTLTLAVHAARSRLDSMTGLAGDLLAALGAALSFHERRPLYGCAATEDDPGACPHPPDSTIHFEAEAREAVAQILRLAPEDEPALMRREIGPGRAVTGEAGG